MQRPPQASTPPMLSHSPASSATLNRTVLHPSRTIILLTLRYLGGSSWDDSWRNGCSGFNQHLSQSIWILFFHSSLEQPPVQSEGLPLNPLPILFTPPHLLCFLQYTFPGGTLGSFGGSASGPSILGTASNFHQGARPSNVLFVNTIFDLLACTDPSPFSWPSFLSPLSGASTPIPRNLTRIFRTIRSLPLSLEQAPLLLIFLFHLPVFDVDAIFLAEATYNSWSAAQYPTFVITVSIYESAANSTYACALFNDETILKILNPSLLYPSLNRHRVWITGCSNAFRTSWAAHFLWKSACPTAASPATWSVSSPDSFFLFLCSRTYCDSCGSSWEFARPGQQAQ